MQTAENGQDSKLELMKQTITIDGNKFSDLKGFHREIDRVMTKSANSQSGHNLNAFNDLLRGGFGVHEYEEPIKLIWKNSAKSKAELNEILDDQTVYDILIDLIRTHQHIEFEEG